ncbi:MAG: M3 family metallopeptidase, partial [Verrucomicrobiota bacterium]
YQIGETVGRVIAEGKRALDEIGAQDPEAVTFESTVGAMSDALAPASLAISRIYLTKETSTNPAIREAATEGVKQMEQWFVGLDYREDLFNVVKALEKKNPRLAGEDRKIYEETLRDFKRAGLYLPKEQREEVEALRKKLSKLTTDFDSNITKAKHPLKYTKADLEGLPDSFIEDPKIKTGDDEYTLMAHVTWHAITLLRNAKKEATRKTFYMARHTLARESNSELLNRIVETRNEIATKLGYRSWADYRVEPRMAKEAKNALKFVSDLRNGLRSKLDSEVDELRKLKVKDTGDDNAKIHIWDWRYYANELKKQKYKVDTEALRVYFPYQKVLRGMFDIYQSIFGLTF